MLSRRTIAVALVLFALAPLARKAGAKTSLALGVTEGATRGFIASEMISVMKHLNASSDYEFELKVFPTQDDLCRALRAGAVQIALLGALKYVEMHAEIGAVPIVSEGARSRTVIIVPRHSPITSVGELRGKRFAFGYADSTTTYLIPTLMLSKYGIHKNDIESTFVGYHPQNLVDQVLAGKFDGGAVSEYIFEKNKDRVRMLEASDPYPGPAVVARKDVSPAMLAAMRLLFTTYKAAPGDENRRFGRGAVPITDEDYNRIRFLAKVLFDKTYH